LLGRHTDRSAVPLSQSEVQRWLQLLLVVPASSAFPEWSSTIVCVSSRTT